MPPIPLGVVCDFREEGWHSMDLIADMLLQELARGAAGRIDATRLQPSMIARWTRLPIVGRTSRARLADRLTGRFRDYPRWLAPQAADFRVFHIVDHSYAHLVEVLPRERTVVTCNDTDAIESGFPLKWSARRILNGLAAARHVACISETTREALIATGRVTRANTSVVYLGVHPSCTAISDPDADRAARARLGPPAGVELLHVGSTVPRKRIDVLLEVLSRVRMREAGARLIRVGDPLTAAQRRQAHALNVLDAIVELPFLQRAELAAVYRRAAVTLLPSDREGFGLPLVESMACGTPVIASDIPALREVGADAGAYCRTGEIAEWATTVGAMLDERQRNPTAWTARREAGLERARRFSWAAYAAGMTRLYEAIA